VYVLKMNLHWACRPLLVVDSDSSGWDVMLTIRPLILNTGEKETGTRFAMIVAITLRVMNSRGRALRPQAQVIWVGSPGLNRCDIWHWPGFVVLLPPRASLSGTSERFGIRHER